MKTTKTLLTIALASTMVACGGGGGGSSASSSYSGIDTKSTDVPVTTPAPVSNEPVELTVKVVDGAVEGAFVSSEKCKGAETDATGVVVIHCDADTNVDNVLITAQGGTDTYTGNPINFQLSAKGSQDGEVLVTAATTLGAKQEDAVDPYEIVSINAQATNIMSVYAVQANYSADFVTAIDVRFDAAQGESPMTVMPKMFSDVKQLHGDKAAIEAVAIYAQMQEYINAPAEGGFYNAAGKYVTPEELFEKSKPMLSCMQGGACPEDYAVELNSFADFQDFTFELGRNDPSIGTMISEIEECYTGMYSIDDQGVFECLVDDVDNGDATGADPSVNTTVSPLVGVIGGEVRDTTPVADGMGGMANARVVFTTQGVRLADGSVLLGDSVYWHNGSQVFVEHQIAKFLGQDKAFELGLHAGDSWDQRVLVAAVLGYDENEQQYFNQRIGDINDFYCGTDPNADCANVGGDIWGSISQGTHPRLRNEFIDYLNSI